MSDIYDTAVGDGNPFHFHTSYAYAISRLIDRLYCCVVSTWEGWKLKFKSILIPLSCFQAQSDPVLRLIYSLAIYESSHSLMYEWFCWPLVHGRTIDGNDCWFIRLSTNRTIQTHPQHWRWKWWWWWKSVARSPLVRRWTRWKEGRDVEGSWGRSRKGDPSLYSTTGEKKVQEPIGRNLYLMVAKDIRPQSDRAINRSHTQSGVNWWT